MLKFPLATLNKATNDRKAGYYHFVMSWMDKQAHMASDEKPY